MIGRARILTSATILAMALGMLSSEVNAAMSIANIGSTAPTEHIFESGNLGSTWTLVRSTNLGDADRGQTFTAPMIGASTNGESWSLSAVTLKANSWPSPAPPSATVNLQIVAWDGALNAGSATKTELYNQSAAFPVSISNGEYFTFDLGTTVSLTEGLNYAFLMSFDTDDADFRIQVTTDYTVHPGHIWQGGTTMKTNQDLEFYLTGIANGSSATSGTLILGK